MIEIALTILGIFGGLTDIGGFALDHPHFWQHRLSDDAMKAECANAFKSYNPDSGLWYGGETGKWKGWHHCPVD